MIPFSRLCLTKNRQERTGRKEMTMTQDDLTQVKYIGPSRLKVLNANGIRTIKQLFDAPLEKLAQIESIGERYAKLIKDAVVEH